jgi:NTP pyrophosphatase (non-canonical NTP hydrolase)
VNSTDDLQARVNEWDDATFPHRTARSIVVHLRREVAELADELEQGGAATEAADCFLLLLDLAGFLGFSLHDAGEAKFAVCQTRQWGEPDSEGVAEHIR